MLKRYQESCSIASMRDKAVYIISSWTSKERNNLCDYETDTELKGTGNINPSGFSNIRQGVWHSPAEKLGLTTPWLNCENIIEAILQYTVGLRNFCIGHKFFAIVPLNITWCFLTKILSFSAYLHFFHCSLHVIFLILRIAISQLHYLVAHWKLFRSVLHTPLIFGLKVLSLHMWK